VRTVLIFSRFFPPRFDVGGRRAYRFAKYLGAHGWRSVVVTDRPAPGQIADESFSDDLGPHAVVVREYYPRRLRPRRNAGSDGTVAAPTHQRTYPPEGWLERLAWQASWPVSNDIWLGPRYWWLARRLARDHRADAILATSSPYSALVFGAIAQRATGLPLCLDLRDPWTENFLHQRRPPWVRRAEARTEQWVLGRAQRITFTAEATLEAYRKKYPELGDDRMQCIYNSFDPEFRSSASWQPGGPLRVLHFGNCYGARSLATVLRAVSRLVSSGRLAASDLELVNYGRVSAADVSLAEELGLAEVLQARGVVPYAAGIEELARADLALLLAYGEETLFVPAKLFDYLLAGTPILCVAPDSELTRLVEATNSGQCVLPHDDEAAAHVLDAALEARRQGRRLIVPDSARVSRFAAPETAQQLARLLDGMCDGEPT
jgi:glycosyltransferase involved in cell wall biosynthesis